MATDEWVQYDDTELINLSRTAQLAETLGIDMLWTRAEDVEWVQQARLGINYSVVADAPWFDPGVPASAEFAGVVSLGLPGLDDSTRESATTEKITDGGTASRARSKTLPIVANVALLASTDRGAAYGKRWLDRVLAGSGDRTFCSGSDLTYYDYPSADSPVMHRRNVTVSRSTSVTRKRNNDCSVLWMVTFTLTANDPFEYGIEVPQFAGLGGVVTGPAVDAEGSIAMTEQDCPVYDYTPVYDPLYPALVPAPSIPDFYPPGWFLEPGITFDRFWVRLNPIEPTTVRQVPVLTLRSDLSARMVRVSVWGSDAEPDTFCDPLWQVIVTYLPAGVNLIVDGEQNASYVWDGVSDFVRRSDSVVRGAKARPVDWTAFNDPGGMLVTLDIMDDTGSVDYDGGGTVRASLSFVSKSD